MAHVEYSMGSQAEIASAAHFCDEMMSESVIQVFTALLISRC